MNSKRTILTVNQKPFIAIAGEVHNSSSSSITYMENVWKKAVELGLNTLLLPVSWELVEPVEDQFSFDLVDGLIEQAKMFDMKIIFLWFGTWKNAQCMYAPEWVKKDMDRFPRAQVEKGKNKTKLSKFYGMEYTTLSYLGEETKAADAKAFARFMKHVKEVDEQEQTVIAVQVENETGLQGAAREHSDEADKLFYQPAPQEFLSYMKTHTESMEPGIKEAVQAGKASGTWEEVFGEYGEEVFSAYYVASYVGAVAAAGRAEYDLPLVVNCWLDKGGEAGTYPTGGPIAKVMEVWKYAAPAIDVFAPDIYVPYFCDICDTYTKLGNPLFIPETAVHSHAAPRLVYSIGHYHATCFAPFGIEDMGQQFDDITAFLFGVDVTDPLLKIPQDISEYGWCARTMNSMMPLLTSKYGTDDLQAVCSETMDMESVDFQNGRMDMQNIKGENLMFGDFGFHVMMNVPLVKRKDGVCLIVKESEDTYYIVANGCMFTPFSANPKKPMYDILSLEEGEFVDGIWHPDRRLNGDESSRFCFNNYQLLKLRVFQYQ